MTASWNSRKLKTGLMCLLYIILSLQVTENNSKFSMFQAAAEFGEATHETEIGDNCLPNGNIILTIRYRYIDSPN